MSTILFALKQLTNSELLLVEKQFLGKKKLY